jgi:transposase
MSTKHGSLSPQALRRLQGGELILKGYDNEDIVDIVGVSLRAVNKWREKLNEHNGDLCCLVRKHGSGRIPRLDDEQKQQLKDIIIEGAVASDYPTERWTSKIVADVIKNTFDVELKPRAVRYLLPTLGLSPQMPVVKSHKHDDEAVIQWATRTWKRLKKKQRNSASP